MGIPSSLPSALFLFFSEHTKHMYTLLFCSLSASCLQPEDKSHKSQGFLFCLMTHPLLLEQHFAYTLFNISDLLAFMIQIWPNLLFVWSNLIVTPLFLYEALHSSFLDSYTLIS